MRCLLSTRISRCTGITGFRYRQGLVRKSYLFRIPRQTLIPRARNSVFQNFCSRLSKLTVPVSLLGDVESDLSSLDQTKEGPVLKRANGRGLKYSAGCRGGPHQPLWAVDPAPYWIWAVRPAGSNEEAPVRVVVACPQANPAHARYPPLRSQRFHTVFRPPYPQIDSIAASRGA